MAYVDWAAYGHQGDPERPRFAGNLTSYDPLTQTDLGFQSVDAEWEADVNLPLSKSATVLHFGPATDLAGVEAKLAAAGFRKTRAAQHDLLALPGGVTGALGKPWAEVVSVVAVDNARHLLVAGVDPDAVNAIFAGPALGTQPDVATLVRRAKGLVTALIGVGERACQRVGLELRGNTSPISIMSAEQKLARVGHFTPFTADLVGLTEPSSTTGTADLVFPDAGAARANVAPRSAAPPVMGEILGADTGLRVGSASVDGAVLHLVVRASQPGVLTDVAGKGGLGFDICL